MDFKGILGSISPAFGLLSGNGMFGKLGPELGQMGMGGILGMLLSDHGGSGASPASGGAPGSGGNQPGAAPMGAMQPTLGTAAPLPSLPGPSIGQTSAAMPQMAPAGPNFGQALGQAFSSSARAPTGAGLSAEGLPPMAGHGGLAAMLQSLGLM